jgi:hypothetical protein
VARRLPNPGPYLYHVAYPVMSEFLGVSGGPRSPAAALAMAVFPGCDGPDSRAYRAGSEVPAWGMGRYSRRGDRHEADAHRVWLHLECVAGEEIDTSIDLLDAPD